MSSTNGPAVAHNSMVAFEDFYLDAATADVFFVPDVGSNKERIPAHKVLLAAKSDVFKAMFYGELKEKGDIKIVDASIAAFKEFLEYFYCTEIDPTIENAPNVLKLADQYNVPACCDFYEKFLGDTITIDNVCSVYGLAIFYKRSGLNKMCEQRIAEATKSVLKSQSFLECDRSVLQAILDLDVLDCAEKDIFDAFMKWTKHAANETKLTKEMVQKYLGDLFYQFRFKSMSFSRFVTLLPEYGHLFTAEEYKEILLLFGDKSFQSTLFTNMHRNLIFITTSFSSSPSVVDSIPIEPFDPNSDSDSDGFEVNFV